MTATTDDAQEFSVNSADQAPTTKSRSRASLKSGETKGGQSKHSSKASGTSSAKNTSKSDPEQDKKRLQKLLSFDREMTGKWAKKQGAILIGTDEVGRGCLAGPVVAAAVHLSDLSEDSELASLLLALDDSKKMSATKREEISEVLKSKCRFAIAEASVEEIDQINILQASLLAMKRALAELGPPQGTAILIDGNKTIKEVSFRQIAVIGGDAISASIAAASVIAKVYRDKLMKDLHEEFPMYRWDSNKGYGSKDHRDAIQGYGLTSWHRRSFCAKLQAEQLSLALPT